MTELAPRRRRPADRLAGAVLVALALALAVISLTGTGSATASGGRLGGDFPEFYGAGRIVAEGDADRLYEADRQAASQAGLFAAEDDGYLDFAYPPAVALVYAPLTALPYRVAYLVQVGAMVGALWLGLRLVRPLVPFARTRPLVALAGAVAFFPMFRAIGGGQNTALTFLCLAAAWRAAHDDRDLLAGACLGALLFKPQLAVLVLLAQLVVGRWRVLLGAAASAVALFGGGVATMGLGWLGPFLEHGTSVPDGDGRVGGGGSVSLLGTAHRFGGDVGDVLVPLAATASVVVAVVCLVAWRRCATGSSPDLALGHAVLAAGTVLASPHVIFYDAGLLLVVALVALARAGGRTGTVLAALVPASALGALDDLPVNPLVLLAVGALAWTLAEVVRPPTATTAPGPVPATTAPGPAPATTAPATTAPASA